MNMIVSSFFIGSSGNQDSYKISDKFELWSDPTCRFEKISLVPSFFFRTSLNLQVTRTGIKFRMSLIMGQIRLLALQLLVLEP